MKATAKMNTRHLSLLKLKMHFPALVFILLFLSACQNDDENSGPNKKHIAVGNAVSVSDHHVLISGYASENGTVHSKFWINTESSNETEFSDYIPTNTLYLKSINDHYRKVYVYKDIHGQLQNYQFDQGSLAENGRVCYYKNNVLTFMDNDSTGTVSSVDYHNDKPYFAGYFGKIIPSEGGNTLRPETPFVWDGHNFLETLPLPEQASVFQGVSTIYVHDTDEAYIGGLCGVPMYWKNSEPVILDGRYGEVWQLTKSGTDLYAVGLINKHNSNSTGHTACYWKNGELHELEDNAQAYGIYIKGDDVYICGAIGTTPVNYTPCYWKNGVRVDLKL
ncbi:hypothetical protein [Galbibacter pacificus]|uniref:DUF4374 domain-containing protein n=1 Tax=Galbibacter pacificus TaxID=2996052 RepID=A0ABT6FRJ0_9FLAO|nr:hypothetical protein [Galbibacter pacificus]MDG3582995.1 hypothetical protein [Galbibacter pacificus]MDG3585886.1 hypothetical protein [Galbibacter pacificus]